MKDFISATGVVILFIALVAAGPLLFIWSLNTLFPSLAIAYTFWNWAAAFFLMAVFNAPKARQGSK